MTTSEVYREIKRFRVYVGDGRYRCTFAGCDFECLGSTEIEDHQLSHTDLEELLIASLELVGRKGDVSETKFGMTPTALSARWRFQCGELAKRQDTEDAITVRIRLAVIAEECNEAGWKPERPEFEDQVFGEINAKFKFWDDVTPTVNAGSALVQESTRKQKLKEFRSKRQEENVVRMAEKKERPAAKPRAPSSPGHKAGPGENRCLCGCGIACKGRFAPGHDSKYHSMIRKVETGKMQLSELPSDMVAGDGGNLRWTQENPPTCLNSAVGGHK